MNSFKHFISLKVRIVNRTDNPMDLSHLEFFGLTSGTAADGVHDPGELGPGAPVRVAAGKTATFRIAFGVKQIKRFELQVSLGTTRQAVVFQR